MPLKLAKLSTITLLPPSPTKKLYCHLQESSICLDIKLLRFCFRIEVERERIINVQGWDIISCPYRIAQWKEEILSIRKISYLHHCCREGLLICLEPGCTGLYCTVLPLLYFFLTIVSLGRPAPGVLKKCVMVQLSVLEQRVLSWEHHALVNNPEVRCDNCRFHTSSNSLIIYNTNCDD